MASSSRVLPILPPTAPFSDAAIKALNAGLAETSPEQRTWLAGFLAGYAAATATETAPAQAAPATAPKRKTPLSILYATEGGNTEAFAQKFAKAAAKQGFQPKILDMGETEPAALAGTQNLVVIASTWGEGDPPARAVPFAQAFFADGAPRLEGTRFAVLALGDTAYTEFCAFGRRLDERLAELGAVRVLDRVDCDVDYEGPASDWSSQAIKLFTPAEADEPSAEIIHLDRFARAEEQEWTARHPFFAPMSERVTITSSRSSRETIHVELDLTDSAIVYEPGDSLAILPENDPRLVEQILERVGLGGDDALARELTRTKDVTTLSRATLEAWNRLHPHTELGEMLAGEGWRSFVADRQLIDLFETYGATVGRDELLQLLRPLPARSYSIASAPSAHPDAAHLLVSVVRWQSHGHQRNGVASSFLADRLGRNQKLGVFLKPNRHFRLPADPSTKVVMIGPGTGVAPFRAFLQHRRETGAPGQNWLFFGERNFTHDFYYQTELQDLKVDGVLSRIDLAFSRDQPEKIYVQDRMWQQRQDLWAWLQDGAHFYVCGDATRMAKDVDQTLNRIATEVGGLTDDRAKAWLQDATRAGRIQRDVY
ncbi:diflavin oxidoreductase [Geminicoccus flavidas]|uniref:diflavin oxidoreductase n=1 Tax=Geminicoccus flavidas TaxID=2506407 RepID=UPI0013583ED0|nr:flavodoxin domain-containing protein [Geminicoccus flavidas]